MELIAECIMGNITVKSDYVELLSHCSGGISDMPDEFEVIVPKTPPRLPGPGSEH